MDSMHASSHTRQAVRISQPAQPNLPCALPPLPRRSPPLLVNIASRRISGFGISERLADLFERNEAVSSSLALRLAGSIHGASTPGSLPSLSASLHAGCSVGMMNTFQFIGLVGGAGAPEAQSRRGFNTASSLWASGFALVAKRGSLAERRVFRPTQRTSAFSAGLAGGSFAGGASMLSMVAVRRKISTVFFGSVSFLKLRR
jgi:hypothetical protein